MLSMPSSMSAQVLSQWQQKFPATRPAGTSMMTGDNVSLLIPSGINTPINISPSSIPSQSYLLTNARYTAEKAPAGWLNLFEVNLPTNGTAIDDFVGALNKANLGMVNVAPSPYDSSLQTVHVGNVGMTPTQFTNAVLPALSKAVNDVNDGSKPTGVLKAMQGGTLYPYQSGALDGVSGRALAGAPKRGSVLLVQPDSFAQSTKGMMMVKGAKADGGGIAIPAAYGQEGIYETPEAIIEYRMEGKGKDKGKGKGKGKKKEKKIKF